MRDATGKNDNSQSRASGLRVEREYLTAKIKTRFKVREHVPQITCRVDVK